MKTPKRISPCPIAEAIVEIRFDSKVPPDAVFGILYNEFKAEYETVEKLPILQLPEIVRTKDTNLKFSPHYKLIQENFILQIGPNVLSIANVKEYVGWNNFSERMAGTFSKAKILGARITRLGIRYINFFELDIFEKLNLKFSLSDKPLDTKQIVFQGTFVTGKYLTNLHILNNGSISVNKVAKSGSIVDIDTYIQNVPIEFSDIKQLLEDGHDEEKKIFFNLLKKDFLKKLNPTY